MSTLEEKIGASRVLLSGLLRRHGPERVAVAWTGGKDSTVALDLWRALLADEAPKASVRALSVDTGLKFPEITAFRDRWARAWGLELVVARPGVELRGYPVAVDKVACCRELKVLPLHRAVRDMGLAALIAGLRRDEHASRAERLDLEPRAALALPGGDAPAYVQCNPLLDWSEMDIWAYITGRDLPFCELYGRGYRSLGCVPCTTRSGRGERSGRAADKEAKLEVLRSLGYF